MKKKMIIPLLGGALALGSLLGCEKLWAPYTSWTYFDSFEACQTALCSAPMPGGTCAQFASEGWRACNPPTLGTDYYSTCVNGADHAQAAACDTTMMPPPPAPDMMPAPPVEGSTGVGVKQGIAADGSPLTCVPTAGTIVFQGTTTTPSWAYTPCTWLKTSDPQTHAIVRIRLLGTDTNVKQYKLDPATVTDSAGGNHGLVMLSDQWYWMNVQAPRDTLITSGAKDSQSASLGFRNYNPSILADEDCPGLSTGTCSLP